MNRVIVAAGSNINPHYHIDAARQQLTACHTVLAESEFIQTTPVGYTEQADFINGAFLVETPLSFQELKHWLRELEDTLGRVRTENKFGPRTIDLDIAVWNEAIVDEDVYSRDFLKHSVLELCPEFASLLK